MLVGGGLLHWQGSDGVWSIPATNTLADGSYKVKAFLADAAGNVSTTSATLDNANKSVVVSTPVAATSVGGAQTNGGLGLSLNSAGDFNGDGINDLAVGSGAGGSSKVTIFKPTVSGSTITLAELTSVTAFQGCDFHDCFLDFLSRALAVGKNALDIHGGVPRLKDMLGNA